MKILLLLFVLALSSPAAAAQVSDPAKAQAPETKTENESAPAQEQPKELTPNEYACKFYKVTLPDDWTAITPPTEQQGNINAIFATTSASAIVTIVVGPNGGADARTIATMFAEQFKAPRQPVERNGRFTFTFPNQGSNAQAIIGVQGKEFMVIILYGKTQEGRDFLRQHMTSEEFGQLLQ